MTGFDAVREAFDRHAGDYDRIFSENPIAAQWRRRVWSVLDDRFGPGHRVIDAGCGTGADAIHLSGRGVFVEAWDVSPKMVDQLRRKVRDRGVARLVSANVGNVCGRGLADAGFDGLYANFGMLNCVEDPAAFGRFASGVLRPGGSMVLVVMGAFYPLEFAVNLARGRFRAAFRRRFGRTGARVDGVDFPVRYHGLGRLRRALGPAFDLERSESFGLVSPSPELGHLGERFPDVFRRLEPFDAWLGRQRVVSGFGDHYLSVWTYRGGER